jgi:hypothetical protein
MLPRALTIVAAVIVLLGAARSDNAVGQGARADARVAAGHACRSVALARRPGWTGSGIFNGDELVLVDTLDRVMVRYALDGRVLGELSGAQTRSLQSTSPAKIAAAAGRLVVQVEGNRFLSLDPGYSFQSAIDARSRAHSDGSTVEKVLTWALAGKDVFGFAEVKSPGERWSSRVVRFSLDEPRAFQSLNNLSVHDASRTFHRLGYSYTAAIGSTGYIVLMENGMRLYRQEQGSDLVEVENENKVNALGNVKVPDLPSFTQPEDYASVMRTVEESAMIAGIVSWARDPKDLFVISRQPRAGTTEWRLGRLDVTAGRIVESTVIPSKAHHLFVVPGDDWWAFVEKGPARGLKEQEVTGVLYVPAPRIRARLQPNLCQ